MYYCIVAICWKQTFVLRNIKKFIYEFKRLFYGYVYDILEIIIYILSPMKHFDGWRHLTAFANCSKMNFGLSWIVDQTFWNTELKYNRIKRHRKGKKVTEELFWPNNLVPMDWLKIPVLPSLAIIFLC